MIAGYQLWLAMAWKLGPGARPGHRRMTRFMAAPSAAAPPPEHIGWQMNYPYAMQWFGRIGGLRGVARGQGVRPEGCPRCSSLANASPSCSIRPLAGALAPRPAAPVHGLDAGHWLMLQKPAEFNASARTGWTGPGASDEAGRKTWSAADGGDALSANTRARASPTCRATTSTGLPAKAFRRVTSAACCS
jgi:cis-3-alkyl-4-acyloxetan-2-one decarboxylase